jgi:hypothetical protein
MRHSTIDLTMNTYTDPELLDVAGALDALPALPLDGTPARQEQRATGTDDRWAAACTKNWPTWRKRVIRCQNGRPRAGTQPTG